MDSMVSLVEDFNDKTSSNSKHIIMVTKEIKTKSALYAYKTKKVQQRKLLAKVISYNYKTKNGLITKPSINYF